MSDDSITLTESEIEFLKYRFKTEDPDEAVDRLIELLVFEGANPMNMKPYVQKLMMKYQC